MLATWRFGTASLSNKCDDGGIRGALRATPPPRPVSTTLECPKIDQEMRDMHEQV